MDIGPAAQAAGPHTFGDAIDTARIFAANKLEPLQARFLELSDWLGAEAVMFRPYGLATDAEE